MVFTHLLIKQNPGCLLVITPSKLTCKLKCLSMERVETARQVIQKWTHLAFYLLMYSRGCDGHGWTTTRREAKGRAGCEPQPGGGNP